MGSKSGKQYAVESQEETQQWSEEPEAEGQETWNEEAWRNQDGQWDEQTGEQGAICVASADSAQQAPRQRPLTKYENALEGEQKEFIKGKIWKRPEVFWNMPFRLVCNQSCYEFRFYCGYQRCKHKGFNTPSQFNQHLRSKVGTHGHPDQEQIDAWEKDPYVVPEGRRPYGLWDPVTGNLVNAEVQEVDSEPLRVAIERSKERMRLELSPKKPPIQEATDVKKKETALREEKGQDLAKKDVKALEKKKREEKESLQKKPVGFTPGAVAKFTKALIMQKLEEVKSIEGTLVLLDRDHPARKALEETITQKKEEMKKIQAERQKEESAKKRKKKKKKQKKKKTKKKKKKKKQEEEKEAPFVNPEDEEDAEVQALLAEVGKPPEQASGSAGSAHQDRKSKADTSKYYGGSSKSWSCKWKGSWDKQSYWKHDQWENYYSSGQDNLEESPKRPKIDFRDRRVAGPLRIAKGRMGPPSSEESQGGDDAELEGLEPTDDELKAEAPNEEDDEMNPEEGIPMKPPQGFKDFALADGRIIPNLGQKVVQMAFQCGLVLAGTFSVVDSAKPLLSVGKMTNLGHTVKMTPDGGQIVLKNGKSIKICFRFLNVPEENMSSDEEFYAPFERKKDLQGACFVPPEFIQDGPGLPDFAHRTFRIRNHFQQEVEVQKNPSCLDDLEPRPGVQPMKSKGSAGHPDTCKECTFYFFSTTGCIKGADCLFCHEFHPRKNGKKNRCIMRALQTRKSHDDGKEGKAVLKDVCKAKLQEKTEVKAEESKGAAVEVQQQLSVGGDGMLRVTYSSEEVTAKLTAAWLVS
ncbi:unnamed protein product [Cladocopium goreaui]|uniref:C3H1-type domain-containing protein n=1 Tax=Cladocopium goreaui TaxID=2562237 RepID=A0A9P1BQM5_9DINO|nr:unnamed protein product [Cladocopium goreaui]